MLALPFAGAILSALASDATAQGRYTYDIHGDPYEEGGAEGAWFLILPVVFSVIVFLVSKALSPHKRPMDQEVFASNNGYSALISAYLGWIVALLAVGFGAAPSPNGDILFSRLHMICAAMTFVPVRLVFAVRSRR